MATLIDPSKASARDAGEQAAAGQATAALTPCRIKRAVLVSMLPEKLGWKERFALAKDIGFDGHRDADDGGPGGGEEGGARVAGNRGWSSTP
jgi:hypothetical protein